MPQFPHSTAVLQFGLTRDDVVFSERDVVVSRHDIRAAVSRRAGQLLRPAVEDALAPDARPVPLVPRPLRLADLPLAADLDRRLLALVADVEQVAVPIHR